ncbi:inositol monophosphatase family protein [Galbitalea sp. SE-J8]|uniref:inositol monophosphatase family protein n=1 Tax=Galbitalea sp. SE-J8 TaxID=3054952 RepID=UPI00259C7DE8|nr:inositol monophosphatase family protein [Galbitalea sp. SE-J8]MDM4762430.1 inositol monophosphatase family protein [Galbitalea sp. SE-J8]
MTSELLDLARTIAVEAGELALTRKREGVRVVATKSNAVDIVTAADREAEQLIRSRIADARPADGFFGEESGGDSGTSGLTWIVDPIDGTVNFLYGIPHWAVSIAVVEAAGASDGPDPQTWRALAGAVVNPAIGEVYTAADAAGASLNGARLELAPAPPFAESLVATGFVYDEATRAHQGAVAARLVTRVRDIRRLGAASLDLCAVAAGRVDAYYESSLSPWDHAAGALVAREAGAIVKGWGDDAAGRELILAGKPALVPRLEETLRELGY